MTGGVSPAHDPPAHSLASTGFVPEAITRTSTSPGPGAGFGTSRRSNSSGPPKRGITIARIRPSFPDALSGRITLSGSTGGCQDAPDGVEHEDAKTRSPNENEQ